MKAEDIQVGKVYVVAGRGPLKVVEAPNPPEKTTVTMRWPGGTVYYASTSQVLREADEEYITNFARAMKDRGLLKQNHAEVLGQWKDEICQMSETKNYN